MDESNTLRVKDHENDIVTMRQLEPTQARETLGVIQAPCLEMKQQNKIISKKKLRNG